MKKIKKSFSDMKLFLLILLFMTFTLALAAQAGELDINAFHFKINQVSTTDKLENLSANECCRFVVVTISGSAPKGGELSYKPNDFTFSFSDANGTVTTQPAVGIGQHLVLVGGKEMDIWSLSHDSVAAKNTSGNVVSRSSNLKMVFKEGGPLDLKVACVLPKKTMKFELRLPTSTVGRGEIGI